MQALPPPILRDIPDEIFGEHVLIRPLRPGDGPTVWEAVEELREQIGPWLPLVEKMLGVDDCEAAARRGAARWQTREDLMVSVFEQITGRYLGGSGLHRIDWSVPAFEIGYWLRTTAWKQGYISETVRVLCRFAVETLGANRVEIQCDERNTRSIAVPRRLGFVQEATLRNNCRDGRGELRDTLIFALTPDDCARAKVEWEQTR